MEFWTKVETGLAGFLIEPFERMLFVGSCFADSIGKRFVEEKFQATVNPYGVMYNPASVLHTVERILREPDAQLYSTVFLTLGTNHVYRLKETGEIVDNCQKRPAALFQEEELSVEACTQLLEQVTSLLYRHNPEVRIVLTVSPIRYRKYGYHGSQLSKATLLLAVDRLVRESAAEGRTVVYFPAYEIVLDELRDYRFYQEDMLHPSAQAVSYIWERLADFCFSPAARDFIKEWAPIKAALNHRPFHADSEEYKAFMDKTMLKVSELQKKYPTFAV